MINKIIDGISNKLYEEFGDEYTIYTEEVKQGLETPCFFINAIDPKEDLFRDNKYFQTNMFCVQYIPNSNEPKKECNSIRDKLFNVLEYITIVEKTFEDKTIKNLIRGNQMHGEYSDSLLNFFVNYDLFVIKNKEEDINMNEYDFKNNVEE